MAPASPASTPSTCWKCNTPVTPMDVVCPSMHCRTIQPVRDVDFFRFLLGTDASPSFAVNQQQLRKRYLELQQRCHPDSWSALPPAKGAVSEQDQLKEDEMGKKEVKEQRLMEKQFAEARSSWLNKAYHTLRDPLLRANYLLSMHGKNVVEEDKLHPDENDQDKAFLLEMMEIRERIDEASDVQELESLAQANQDRIRSHVEGMTLVFEELLKRFDQPDVALLDEAKKLTVQLKYLYNIDQACRESASTK